MHKKNNDALIFIVTLLIVILILTFGVYSYNKSVNSEVEEEKIAIVENYLYSRFGIESNVENVRYNRKGTKGELYEYHFNIRTSEGKIIKAEYIDYFDISNNTITNLRFR